jgi:SH3-like domain-containing protein
VRRRRPTRKLADLILSVAAGTCLALASVAPSWAADDPLQVGTSTGLPLPRYVSLKSDRVNLREGPSEDHPTKLIFERAGLPVEVTAEFDVWRRIRDADGDEGWVIQSLLSGRRTALVKPWAKGEILPLYDKASADSGLDARLQSGVIGNVRQCTGSWCRIYGSGFDGWIQQVNLWGVYPNEKID